MRISVWFRPVLLCGLVAMSSKSVFDAILRENYATFGGHDILPVWFEKTWQVLWNRNDHNRDHGIAPHRDYCETYSDADPITSFSFGCGGLLTLMSQTSGKGASKMLIQEHGDVLIMAGKFQQGFFSWSSSAQSLARFVCWPWFGFCFNRSWVRWWPGMSWHVCCPASSAGDISWLIQMVSHSVLAWLFSKLHCSRHDMSDSGGLQHVLACLGMFVFQAALQATWHEWFRWTPTCLGMFVLQPELQAVQRHVLKCLMVHSSDQFC